MLGAEAESELLGASVANVFKAFEMFLSESRGIRQNPWTSSEHFDAARDRFAFLCEGG